ncbi:MAG TPA: histidinol-phosphate transaminase [Thermomicrobiales bacterium]|nr:histidinol-phosphate transaminase [Thermomicrobiales bacterium]
MSSQAVLRQFDPSSVVREPVRAKSSYVPSPRDERHAEHMIRLDMNESPYGPSPKAQAAIAAFVTTHRYPDFDQWALRDAFANYTGTTAEQIFCGAGADDVLNLLAQATLEPGDNIVISEPTFGVYRAQANLRGATTVDVPLGAGFQLDAEGVLAAIDDRTKYVVICTPNNPTGNDLKRSDIDRIVEEAPCLVVIDEAYSEFSGTTYADYPDRFQNVIVFRTMSKFAGMAGMRVGYAIVPHAMAPHMENIVQPCHNVSFISSETAIASLNDLDYLNGIVDRIVTSRDELAANLREIPGVEPYPSATNFLLVELPVEDAGPVVAELGKRGILVRHFANPSLGLMSCLRVTIGLPEENERFFNELADILENQ